MELNRLFFIVIDRDLGYSYVVNLLISQCEEEQTEQNEHFNCFWWEVC